MNTNLIKSMLDKINGKRYTRTVSLSEVESEIEDIVSKKQEVGVLGAYRVANAYKYPAVTSVVVVYRRDDGHIVIGAGICQARAASPGRVWPQLSPWKEPSEWNENNWAKIEVWSKTAQVII